MARTYTISGSLITISGDPFDEGRDDFIEIDLADENGDAVADAAVNTITATLRSKVTGSIINSRDGQNVKGTSGTPVNGGALSSGTFRLDLSPADLVPDATAAGRTLQARELTLIVTLTDGTQMPIVVRFLLRVFDDVG